MFTAAHMMGASLQIVMGYCLLWTYLQGASLFKRPVFLFRRIAMATRSKHNHGQRSPKAQWQAQVVQGMFSVTALLLSAM